MYKTYLWFRSSVWWFICTLDDKLSPKRNTIMLLAKKLWVQTFDAKKLNTIPQIKTNTNQQKKIIKACYQLINPEVKYNSTKTSLSYPMGDVPKKTGVCTDVVIRVLRLALNIDLQKLIHDDINKNPNRYKLQKTDTSIDHRRVKNQIVYFQKHAKTLKPSMNPDEYKPGDIVVWKFLHKRHIGIVLDRKNPKTNTPLIFHNTGWGQVVDDFLFQRMPTLQFRL